MNEAQSIMSIIRGATMSEDGSVIEAKVIGAGPLKVKATNDDKLILNAGSLVVPWHLTDYTTKMTYRLDKGTLDSETYNDGPHGGHVGGDGTHINHLRTFNLYKGTITVYNALKVGDIVYLLRYNDGKKYFILDRKEE